MIRGKFLGERQDTPVIKVAISNDLIIRTLVVILDTGFTSDLKIPPEIADELGLEEVTFTAVRIADNRKVHVPVSVALCAMEGIFKDVEIIISEGPPAAGIGFLSKFSYKAILDCKNKTVILETVLTMPS